MNNLIKWIGSVIGIMAIAFFLFSHKQVFRISSPIDSSRFSDYGSFIAGIFSALTLILVVYTYLITKEQSLDSIFFNLLQTHQFIVQGLHSRITDTMMEEYEKLDKQYGSKYGIRKDKNFFELIYRMLALEYRPEENTVRNLSNVSSFFKKHNWMMGHYFKSLIYFINWVHKNRSLSSEKKSFYIGFIQAQLTNDEIRLFLYYLISGKEEINKKKLAKLLRQYTFFDFDAIADSLIYFKNMEDWNEYYELSK